MDQQGRKRGAGQEGTQSAKRLNRAAGHPTLSSSFQPPNISQQLPTLDIQTQGSMQGPIQSDPQYDAWWNLPLLNTLGDAGDVTSFQTCDNPLSSGFRIPFAQQWLHPWPPQGIPNTHYGDQGTIQTGMHPRLDGNALGASAAPIYTDAYPTTGRVDVMNQSLVSGEDGAYMNIPVDADFELPADQATECRGIYGVPFPGSARPSMSADTMTHSNLRPANVLDYKPYLTPSHVQPGRTEACRQVPQPPSGYLSVPTTGFPHTGDIPFGNTAHCPHSPDFGTNLLSASEYFPGCAPPGCAPSWTRHSGTCDGQSQIDPLPRPPSFVQQQKVPTGAGGPATSKSQYHGGSGEKKSDDVEPHPERFVANLIDFEHKRRGYMSNMPDGRPAVFFCPASAPTMSRDGKMTVELDTKVVYPHGSGWDTFEENDPGEIANCRKISLAIETCLRNDPNLPDLAIASWQIAEMENKLGRVMTGAPPLRKVEAFEDGVQSEFDSVTQRFMDLFSLYGNRHLTFNRKDSGVNFSLFRSIDPDTHKCLDDGADKLSLPKNHIPKGSRTATQSQLNWAYRWPQTRSAFPQGTAMRTPRIILGNRELVSGTVVADCDTTLGTGD